MKPTKVFDQTLAAYLDGYRYIANKGGSRSGKTFSALQLFLMIMLESNKSRLITVVSHSFEHLRGGAIRDFDKILECEGVVPDDVRTKSPYIYTIGHSKLEFIGFDKMGKALGAARDILFINEANKMPWQIIHQLLQRTTETVFYDWNPANDFWHQNEGLVNEDCTCEIVSTFFDNIQNLTAAQIEEFKRGKRNAAKEELKGKKGYWYNWWRVYGLGLDGILEGVIFEKWEEYTDLPHGDYFQFFGIDWGGNDPTTVCEVNIRENNMYIREHLYQPQVLNSKLIDLLNNIVPLNAYIICDSARKDKIYELQCAGLNAIGSTKGAGSIIDGLDMMHEFNIFVYSGSENAKRELAQYCWAKDRTTGKSLSIPEDDNNHIIDPVRYITRFYYKNIKAV